jgi:uncharacterized membrane protein YozB (DUF420 family)
MVMCITIEGAIYHYLQIFHRPFVGSLVANVVSLVAGIPLALLAAIDPTWVLLPTVASILIEYAVLKRFRKKVTLPNSQETTHRDISVPVVTANILTNIFMVLYLFKSYIFA